MYIKKNQTLSYTKTIVHIQGSIDDAMDDDVAVTYDTNIHVIDFLLGICKGPGV